MPAKYAACMRRLQGSARPPWRRRTIRSSADRRHPPYSNRAFDALAPDVGTCQERRALLRLPLRAEVALAATRDEQRPTADNGTHPTMAPKLSPQAIRWRTVIFTLPIMGVTGCTSTLFAKFASWNENSPGCRQSSCTNVLSSENHGAHCRQTWRSMDTRRWWTSTSLEERASRAVVNRSVDVHDPCHTSTYLPPVGLDIRHKQHIVRGLKDIECDEESESRHTLRVCPPDSLC